MTPKDRAEWLEHQERLYAMAVDKDSSDNVQAACNAGGDAIMTLLSRDEMNTPQDNELSASEALYAFGGWLTVRDEPLTVSARHNAAPMAERIQEFCKTYGLSDPRDGWDQKVRKLPGGFTPRRDAAPPQEALIVRLRKLAAMANPEEEWQAEIGMTCAEAADALAALPPPADPLYEYCPSCRRLGPLFGLTAIRSEETGGRHCIACYGKTESRLLPLWTAPPTPAAACLEPRP